jgi:hypothetical protein
MSAVWGGIGESEIEKVWEKMTHLAATIPVHHGFLGS